MKEGEEDQRPKGQRCAETNAARRALLHANARLARIKARSALSAWVTPIRHSLLGRHSMVPSAVLAKSPDRLSGN